MLYARVLRAALPLLSFFATGAIAGQEGKQPTVDLVDYGKLGWHGQHWPEINAKAVMTDFFLSDGRQEVVVFIMTSPNVGKVTITFPATKNSGPLVPADKGTFWFSTDITEMGDVDEKVFRPCLMSIVRNSSKIVGSPFQDIDHCLKKFNFKFDNDPKEYYLDNVRRYE